MDSSPGTYALLLRCDQDMSVQIGRWGRLVTRPGYYVYVGSAFGPGGLRARVLRHWRRDKTPHWHLDYLRAITTPVLVWYSRDARRLEHRWAQALAQLPGMRPVQGFGCSDCRCAAHLFFAAKRPTLATFARVAPGDPAAWRGTTPD